MSEQKRTVQYIIEQKTGIKVDQPDPTGPGSNSNAGNVVRKMFWNKENRDILAECAPEEDQEQLKKMFKHLAILLRLISSDRKINTEKVEILCKETATIILDDSMENYRFLIPFIFFWLIPVHFSKPMEDLDLKN